LLLRPGRFAKAAARAYIGRRYRLLRLELTELANKTGRIERGDRLLMELPVAATWPDGKVTVTINGTRFTIAADNPEIREVLKAAKEKAVRGGRRVKIGGSPLAKIFDEGR
jgi:hypothetical protein